MATSLEMERLALTCSTLYDARILGLSQELAKATHPTITIGRDGYLMMAMGDVTIRHRFLDGDYGPAGADYVLQELNKEHLGRRIVICNVYYAFVSGQTIKTCNYCLIQKNKVTLFHTTQNMRRQPRSLRVSWVLSDPRVWTVTVPRATFARALRDYHGQAYPVSCLGYCPSIVGRVYPK